MSSFQKPIRLILSEQAGDTAANLPGPGGVCAVRLPCRVMCEYFAPISAGDKLQGAAIATPDSSDIPPSVAIKFKSVSATRRDEGAKPVPLALRLVSSVVSPPAALFCHRARRNSFPISSEII